MILPATGNPEHDSDQLAALWDMDGVLVESAQFHYVAWKRAWGEMGIDITEADFRKNFGQRNDTIIRDMLGDDVSQDVIDRLGPIKEQYYRDAIKGQVEPLPGALELLKALREDGFHCAMSSAAPRANVELILSELHCASLFEALVTFEDVTRGKPDPQVYLIAAERVGVAPARSVVLEDAVAGVEGAKRAGMACLAVTSNHSRQALAKADLIVDSLTQATPDRLRKLILGL
jgi:HAD superfamily hydrolase (TIGR01509 family)